MSQVKQHIRGNCRFTEYRNGNLWYKTTDTQFEFPVPVNDLGTASLHSVERSMPLMRYIRKHLADIEAGQSEVDRFAETFAKVRGSVEEDVQIGM